MWKLNEPEHEMEKCSWNIPGIIKMSWLRKKNTEEGHKVWWTGDSEKRLGGVGFIVHHDFMNTIMECEPISNRII